MLGVFAEVVTLMLQLVFVTFAKLFAVFRWNHRVSICPVLRLSMKAGCAASLRLLSVWTTSRMFPVSVLSLLHTCISKSFYWNVSLLTNQLKVKTNRSPKREVKRVTGQKNYLFNQQKCEISHRHFENFCFWCFLSPEVSTAIGSDKTHKFKCT